MVQVDNLSGVSRRSILSNLRTFYSIVQSRPCVLGLAPKIPTSSEKNREQNNQGHPS
jgi:hypothetical protein